MTQNVMMKVRQLEQRKKEPSKLTKLSKADRCKQTVDRLFPADAYHVLAVKVFELTLVNASKSVRELANSTKIASIRVSHEAQFG